MNKKDSFSLLKTLRLFSIIVLAIVITCVPAHAEEAIAESHETFEIELILHQKASKQSQTIQPFSSKESFDDYSEIIITREVTSQLGYDSKLFLLYQSLKLCE